jgi:hypothetical protein
MISFCFSEEMFQENSQIGQILLKNLIRGCEFGSCYGMGLRVPTSRDGVEASALLFI